MYPIRFTTGAFLLFFLFSAAPGRAQEVGGPPAEVLFVFGSDTSTPGISVDRRSTYYHASGFDLFAGPTQNAAEVMNDAFRARYRDFYGAPLRLTWWMQAGSLYRFAENTNVPLASTMSPYLMRKYHGAAVERLGDEFTFHYHTWVWNDDNGDGRFYWNQARAFEESRADFDLTMAEMLLEEDTYPVSFRSGWHYMDDAWQARLDQLLPFSLHAASPYRHDDRVEPIDNLFDWSRAPTTFIPYRPSSSDYQLPGGRGGWNTRSVSLWGVTEAYVRQAFEAARAGETQVPCFWGHLADPAFVGQLEEALAVIERVAPDYPDVPYRYTTAVDAMQRWLETDDRTPPVLTVTTVARAGGTVLRVTSDEPIFQEVPFVALKDVYETHRVLDLEHAGALAWETTEPYDPAEVAKVAVAATDSSGNLARALVRYLPDDVYVDNEDDAYDEPAGAWQTIGSSRVDQAWGRNVRAATLAPGEAAEARWLLDVVEEADYQVYVRLPDVENAAGGLELDVYADGVRVDGARFDAPPPPDVWLYVGTARLVPGGAHHLTLRASGDGQPGAVLAADAVRVSALRRARQLRLPSFVLDLGDAVRGDTATVSLPLQNLGSQILTVHAVTTTSGVLAPAAAMPFVLDPHATRSLRLRLHATAQGAVADTLVFHSDDPRAPARRLPFRVRFMDYFALADNDEPGYEEAGTWHTSVTQAYGASSRYAFVPGAPDATATFTLEVDQAGVYDAAYIIPRSTNSAVRADYEVAVDGTVLGTQRVNQNEMSGRWRSVGLYDVPAGAAVSVTVRAADADQPGRVLRADAARLARLGAGLAHRVVDDGTPGRYRETGEWRTSVAQAHGASSRFAFFGGDPRAVFSFDAERTGLHAVAFIVPSTVNASQAAKYRILIDGAALDSLVVDQNAGSGAWRALGSWYVETGQRLEVEVANAETSASSRVLRADAVRVSFGVEASTAYEEEGVPSGFGLTANYPNPFASETRFAYTLPRAAEVRVELFDVLGRRVAVLDEGPRSSGTHAVRFDGARLASGVYLCRLQADGRTATRRWTVVH